MELDGQKVTDKVTELLYMLDDEGNEFAAAVLSVALSTFLDSVNDAKITDHHRNAKHGKSDSATSFVSLSLASATKNSALMKWHRY